MTNYWIISSFQIAKYWIIRTIAFHDIPLERICIVSIVDILVRAALFQGRDIRYL